MSFEPFWGYKCAQIKFVVLKKTVWFANALE